MAKPGTTTHLKMKIQNAFRFDMTSSPAMAQYTAWKVVAS
jgi:hypothetical protein